MHNGKTSIVVSKMGGVHRFPDGQAGKSVRGEILGETMGMMRWLVDAGYHVVYYGKASGTPPEGMHLVEPQLGGLNEDSDPAEQDEVMREGEERLAEHDPDLFINVLGMDGTNCWLGSGRGITMQASQIRYMAPQLHAVEAFNRPRICINNDPRSYPKIQEMSYCWHNTIPCAILSQRTGYQYRVVGGKSYDQREVYAGAENWWKYKAERPDLSLYGERTPCTIVAHAHIIDGCRQKNRDWAWQVIFAHENDEAFEYQDFQRLGIRVYGKGWEGFTGFAGNDVFPGVVPPAIVNDMMLTTWCMPTVAPSDRFYTSKAAQCAWHGCAPLFYGGRDASRDGQAVAYAYDAEAKYVPLDSDLRHGQAVAYAYDAEAKYVPLDSDLRIRKPGDLERLIGRFGHGGSEHTAYVEMINEMTKPDFSILQHCLNDYEKLWRQYGTNWRVGVGDYYWDAYGGMRYATEQVRPRE